MDVATHHLVISVLLALDRVSVNLIHEFWGPVTGNFLLKTNPCQMKNITYIFYKRGSTAIFNCFYSTLTWSFLNMAVCEAHTVCTVIF